MIGKLTEVMDIFLRNPSIISFHITKIFVTAHWPKFKLLTLKLSWYCRLVFQEWQHFFLKLGCCCQQLLTLTQKRSEFEQKMCLPVQPVKALLEGCLFRHWFCSQNLQLSSGIACRRHWQMIGWGLNLDSNLNSAACPTICNGSICSEVPE